MKQGRSWVTLAGLVHKPQKRGALPRTEPLTGLLPDFLALSGLIPAGLSCAFMFSQVLKFNQRWVWTSRPTQQLTSRAEAVLEDELVSMGAPPQMGAGHGDCPRSQPSVAMPLDVLARLPLAALLPLLRSGPMRSPSLGHVPEPHKNCRYLMRVCRPPCGNDRVPWTSV